MKPREIVANESPNRIRDHLGRKARYNPTKSLTALTSQLSQEYEDRFLVELIQNAYDAHKPGTRDGRVYVRLDESGDEAVLYVANTGRPFSEANFDALTNVAQSSKPPGEGIGNKGVGFRSVLQVCESPEIYSCDPNGSTSSTFDGFCFGFATATQIRDMVSSDAEYDVVSRDFSRYLLPVVADPADPYLVIMRSLGMATVVRLPLASERAVELARVQVAQLLEPTPPIALFLDRLASITVEHVGGDGRRVDADEDGEPPLVERRVDEIAVPTDGLSLHKVHTVGKQFLVATQGLAGEQVRAVVEEGIAKGELDRSWAAWDSDVEVSLAVPLDDEPDGSWPSTYTYLPMRVPSPVFAHLHAPFHTKLARLDLKEDSHFNSYLIRTAVALAAAAVQLLAGDVPLNLDPHQRRTAAVDLLCWNSQHIGHIRAALDDLGLDVETSPLVPVHGPRDTAWAGLGNARVWGATELEILTTDAVKAHAFVLDGSLGQERVGRLNTFATAAISRDLHPSDAEIADWVEHIARDFEKASLARWNRFLTDVAKVFESRHAMALQGRFILLDDKRKLRRSGPWQADTTPGSDPTVFIPPLPTTPPSDADESAELLEVPKNLSRAVTFLHEGIRVRARTGRTFQRTPVGELFKNADLVEPFELAAVLGHLERLLAGKVSNTTYRQALAWVYTQERASRANVADLGRLGLHVPTASGWVPATRAVFSPQWETPRAEAVAALVRESAGASQSLKTLGASAIVDPAHWPFKLRDLEAFRDFLFRCGVRDGLFPVALRSRTAIRMNGNSFEPAVIAHRFELVDYEHWRLDVNASWNRRLEGPYTPYTGQQDLWVVPGQDAIEELGPHAKDRLAAALLESLADWPEETQSYVFQRRSPHHRSRPDPQRWPSPARTFVERTAWFPMSNPGQRDERYFVAVRDGWTFDETTSEVAPRFARLAPIDHRRRLAASPSARSRLERVGLNTWNSPSSAAARLAELAALVASGEVAAGELPSIRRAASRAWSELVDLPQAHLAQNVALMVVRGAVVGVAEPNPTDPLEVFVNDVPPGLVAQVLEAGEFPVLVADPASGTQIIDLLEESEGFHARATSTVEAKVVLDGEQLSPESETGELVLSLFGSWLVRTILAIVDIRSSRFVRVTNKVLHEAEARLRRMRIAVGSNIEVVIDSRSLPATGRLAESVHLNHPAHPLMVLNGVDVPVPSWRALEVLADDLSELIGQEQAASEIRAAALALQRSVDEWREPSDSELARALRCSVESVVDVLRNLRTSTDHLRFLIVPFIAVEAGIESARSVEAEPLDDLDALKQLVIETIGDRQADALFHAAEREERIDDIRIALGTDLGALNAVLVDLGRDQVTFPELHAAALNSYLDAHRGEVLGELRLRFVGRFDAHDDLAGYTASREFADLVPDPAWLVDHEVPSDTMLNELVLAWLATKGEPPAVHRTLEPIDEVRSVNQALLAHQTPAVAEVVTAWLTKVGQEIPDAWTDLQQVRDTLAAAGVLDFVPLDTPGLLAWMKALGIWPAGMSVTVDHTELGLTAADLAAGKASGTESEGRRRRRQTELTFGSQTYDTASDELGDFADAIEASVSDDFLSARATVTRLAEIPPRKPVQGRGRSGGGGSSGSSGGSKPTNEVTAAIGLAGEILAYRWLQQTYTETTPDSWVSRNRRFRLGGHPGNDTLGYDFRIARKNETLLFEVKATKTDEYEFDIGESELRAARATRRSWYRIIFIRSVLSPADRELLVLPHPLDPCYAQVNQGLRLQFDPVSGRAR